MSDWRDFLRDASWRNVPFGVLTHEARAGRATAVHDYPFRDDVWVEDLGKAPRRFSLTGFLVDDNVVALEDEMMEAAEEEGPGELVHPHFGLMTVSLLDFSAVGRSDLGRVVELQFLFIQGGLQLQPGIEEAVGGFLGSLSNVLDAESLSDFGSTMGEVLKGGSAVVGATQSTVQGYVNIAQRVSNSATGVLRSVGGVASAAGINVGRFNRLTSSASRGISINTGGVNSVAGAVSRGLGAVTAARAAVTRGINNVNRLVGML